MRISDWSSDVCSSDLRAEAHAGNPVVSAELPPRDDGLAGERFEGLLPPVATAPCFAIRKPAAKIYTLDDYVADRIVMPVQADALRKAVQDRHNLLIVGGDRKSVVSGKSVSGRVAFGGCP